MIEDLEVEGRICKGIMPKFNTSEWGVLGEGWEKERTRSKQKGCSLKRKCC